MGQTAKNGQIIYNLGNYNSYEVETGEYVGPGWQSMQPIKFGGRQIGRNSEILHLGKVQKMK